MSKISSVKNPKTVRLFVCDICFVIILFVQNENGPCHLSRLKIILFQHLHLQYIRAVSQLPRQFILHVTRKIASAK